MDRCHRHRHRIPHGRLYHAASISSACSDADRVLGYAVIGPSPTSASKLFPCSESLLHRGLAAEQPTKKKNMPQFAANLSLLFNELPFMERFAAAKAAGFMAVE